MACVFTVSPQEPQHHLCCHLAIITESTTVNAVKPCDGVKSGRSIVNGDGPKGSVSAVLCLPENIKIQNEAVFQLNSRGNQSH